MVTKERLPKPDWLKVRFPAGDRYSEIKGLLRQHQLHTVCEEAHCPNIGECFNLGEATFMILGDVCTRACGFCAVTSGRPTGYDLLEPVRLAQTVETLGLDYVVITSVNRDDLADGGSAHMLVWGRYQTENAINSLREILDADYFVCGHQPQEQGYDVLHERMIILASEHNHGVFLTMDLAKPVTLEYLLKNIRPFAAIA